MITEKYLHGRVIYLRQIELADCTDEYVNWLNDTEINQYLETKYVTQTLETVKSFVISQRDNDHSVLFAICLRDDGRHIGNIKIGPVNPRHKHADISYFIGNRDMWGKGFAREAISLICGFGFNELGLHKIEAGTYECAVNSQKVLKANGFRCEGTLRQHVFFEQRYIDCFRWGLIREDRNGAGLLREDYERIYNKS